MTPADRRITELIDKWLASIDLHLEYAELSDAAYARVQPWPKHDRPTRWVLEVARQKILELKSQCEARQAMGDGKFSESLELMSFLANLVGIQHIQRFVPLADPVRGPAPSATQTVEMLPADRMVVQQSRAAGDEPTREMPRLKPAAAAAAAKPAPAAAAKATEPARPAAPASKQRAESVAKPARAAGNAPAKAAAAPKSAAAVDVRSRIIADAVRLLKWGKSWHELADLIARIADRPSAAEIRKVLRTHKSEIEAKAEGR